MAEEDDDGIFHDLGILFVHGIGQTGRSETLLRFGEPLRKCIEELVTPGRDSSAVSVSISEACLDPEPGKGPAHAELRISGAEKDSRWILAEAWWAKKFPTATFGEIASWCFKVVPWTLVAHFDRQFRRTGFRIAAALDEGHTLTGYFLALRWVVEASKLILALVLLPLLLAILVAVTLIGIIPFTPVRNFARSLQRILAATLGDSFVLLDQPIIGAAITASVRADLEWLAKRCRRVAIVAHSQGAAIAHRVLRGPMTAPCNLFISLGSGLAKLEEISHVSEQEGHKWLWLASGGALLAALCLCGDSVYLWHGGSIWADWLAPSMVIMEIGALMTLIDLWWANRSSLKTPTKDTPPAWRWGFLYVVISCGASLLIERPFHGWLQPAFAAAFAAGLALTYFSVRRWQIASGRSLNERSQWKRDREFYRQHFQLRNRLGMRWSDFFASADPVPNGPLLDDFDPKDLRSCEVMNAHSIVTDHTSYWKNKDEFLPSVAKELLRIAGVGSRYVDLERVARRRRWRMGWRVATRWILAFAAEALAARWLADRPPFLDALAKAFPASGFPLALLHNRPERLLPLVVTVLWALAAAVVLFFWRLWEAKEADAGISGEAYGWAGWRFITFLVLLCCCLCAGYWLARGFSGVADLGLFFGAAALVFLSKRARDWLVLVSQSGEPGMLRRLRTKVLTDEAAVAFEEENSSELTRVGLALLGLDDKLAIKALSHASDLGSVNAAWRLGLHFDVAADRAADAASRTALRQEAKKEFEKGMKLGDASCAWFLGSRENRDENIDGAIQAYRRAVELGDFSACSFLGRLLESRDQEEAMRMLEEGARHNDGYSVNCLAYQLESQSRDLRQSKPDEFKALRQRAADLYRRAFDLGYTDAAFSEGKRRRDVGDIAGSRRAFVSGARLHIAACAFELGLLEEEEQQDLPAARAAYDLAIRLDEQGGTTMQAQYRLGRLFEKEGKVRAAEHLFRSAMGLPGNTSGSADAAVALSRLLKDDEAKDALLRGLELNARAAAKAYVEFIVTHTNRDAALHFCSQEKWLEELFAEPLFKLGELLRWSHPAEAEKLFRRAIKKGSVPAAMELYSMLMSHSIAEANAMLETISAQNPNLALLLIPLFKKDNRPIPTPLQKLANGHSTLIQNQ